MEYLFELSDNLLKSSRQDFKRYLFSQIPADQRLVIIKGARGTGKTTLLLQLMKSLKIEHHEKLYVSLDNIYFLEHKLFEIADRFRKQGGKYLFLDEVHRYPGWALEIKNIYDHFQDLHIVGTGSSALNIHKGEADLSRRALMFRLNELSIREFLDLSFSGRNNIFSFSEILSHHREISLEIIDKNKPLRIFRDYLRYGAYPYFLEGVEYYHERLRAGINTILESDLPSLENISYHSTVQIKKLLFILSESVPFTPNISELGRKMGISRDVILRYLYLLEKAELIFQLRRETRGISYLSKPEKLYLHNPNISFALSPQRPDIGNLRETFMLNQLSVKHDVTWTANGDFCIDNKYILEVGGKKKTKNQIDGIPYSFIAADDIETGFGNKIPLWLFGFLY
ncbi:MAG: AAA family ATPase [Bacteroidales bacterium]|nr:AAA family ATPase [Bacteroidales bacterium]